MKRLFSTVLLAYFLLGALLLPAGNFSSLGNLPEMFRHCRQTEDPDMDLLDFTKDHLVNIDGLFDQHETGDDQKPHQPPAFKIQNALVLFVISTFSIDVSTVFYPEPARFASSGSPTILGFAFSVFRPPIPTQVC